MKIVIAPQEFKESLKGIEIARAMREGIQRVWPNAETELLPVADGGDGTLQSLVDASQGRIEIQEVNDPLGRPIKAEWGVLGNDDNVVIEMARASGLALISPQERNPLIASTYGVGELILAALDAGHRRIIIGIGGSATNDGGSGMAQAIGVRFLDSNGEQLPPGGAALSQLHTIDTSSIDPRLAETYIDVACDVNNPLCGETGASAIFGPQKGATPDDVEFLDQALARYGEIIERDTGRKVAHLPGAGAAGGLGAGLMAFTNAQLRPGADIVIDALQLRKRLQNAALVIVGEGQTDRSTVFNKAPVAVASIAAEHNTPVIVISGSLGEGYELVLEHGIDAAFSILPRCMTVEDAIADTARLVADTTEQVARAISLSLPE